MEAEIFLHLLQDYSRYLLVATLKFVDGQLRMAIFVTEHMGGNFVVYQVRAQ
jgi:hypothetical protein